MAVGGTVPSMVRWLPLPPGSVQPQDRSNSGPERPLLSHAWHGLASSQLSAHCARAAVAAIALSALPSPSCGATNRTQVSQGLQLSTFYNASVLFQHFTFVLHEALGQSPTCFPGNYYQSCRKYSQILQPL